VAVTPYSGAVFALNVSADVLLVSIEGHVRLSDGQIDTTGPFTSVMFCTKSGGCPKTCPDGSPLPQALTPLGQASVLAIDGAANGAAGDLQGTTLEALCRTSPSAPPSTARIYLDKVGIRIDAVSCTGPFGSYEGTLRWGSMPGTNTGYLPYPPMPYLDLPIAFAISGSSGHATVTGTKTIGGVPWTIEFDLTFTLNGAGDKVSITGSDTARLPTIPTTAAMSYPDVPITEAPAGRCP
jgi:hypothetical protein